MIGDARRRMVLQRIRLQDRLRQLDFECAASRDALGKTARSGQRAYRNQHAADLRSRLNAILRERHTAAARLDTCLRELTP